MNHCICDYMISIPIQPVSTISKVSRFYSNQLWSYGSWIYNYLYAISAYYHEHCGFKSRSWRVVLNTTFGDKVVSDLRQVNGFVFSGFPPTIKLTATI